MSWAENLSKKVVREKEREVVELCSALIRTPSENPPGDTSAVVEVLKEWLGDRGLNSEVYDAGEGRLNLVSKIGSGRPILIFNSHMDVVPAGDRSGWSFHPFGGEVREGKILGRGASDTKSGVAAMAVALEVLSQVEERFEGSILFTAVADEETGGLRGTYWLVEKNVLPKADACIIGEPTNAEYAVVGEKGICAVELQAVGRTAHGSTPMLGENAIERLFEAVERVKEIQNQSVKPPKDLEEAFENTRISLRQASEKLGLPRERAEKLEAVCETYTVNLGIIQGGFKRNVVPDRCRAELDVRIPIGVSPREAFEKIKKLAESVKGVSCNLIDESDPNYTSPSDPICQAISYATSSVLGRFRGFRVYSGATDAEALRNRGIPTVIYGPGNDLQAHVQNEYVEVWRLRASVGVYVLASLTYLTHAGTL